MFTISKEFHFSASHVLNGLPEDHPCSRLHGHNYVVTFYLRSDELNKVGMVQDYRELEPIKKFIDENWDHQHLNDKLKVLNPTAENMAFYLYYKFKDRFPMIVGVGVKETEKTFAYYGKQIHH